MVLRNDVFRMVKDSKKVQYIAMVPVAGVRGKVLIPIVPSTDFDGEVREGKLGKLNDGFHLYFTVQEEVAENNTPSNLLAIDLGVKNIANTVNLALCQGSVQSLNWLLYKNRVLLYYDHVKTIPYGNNSLGCWSTDTSCHTSLTSG